MNDLSIVPFLVSMALSGDAPERPQQALVGPALLTARIDALAKELDLVKAQLAQEQEAHPPAPTPPRPKPDGPTGINLWGYGEAYFNRPTRVSDLAQADLARAVFGIGYQFSDSTRFNSEFEVEHAVASSSDPGEFEVEQFYVDQKLSEKVSVEVGLFLIPMGLLNEHHEPTNFYGVQRNFVETLIIPSTWREGGVALQGDSGGFAWAAGVATGLDLSKWEFTPNLPRTALELEDSGIAPMQATHQELAFAHVRNPSEFVSARYHGVPGLTLGASAFTGGVVPADPAAVSHVTIWEGHARYEPGKWDLSGLYAHGALTGTASANLAQPSRSNPIPAAFSGFFLQAGYRAWQKGDYRIAPFARYEAYDMGARYAGVQGDGSTPSYAPRDHVTTLGANFYLHSGVVLKADYQGFRTNREFTRVDLGLGVAF